MTPKAAAAEYARLATIAADTQWGSDEWKAAVGFALAFEETATEETFSEYLDALEADHYA
jgi:hypothetical protein